MKKKRKRRRKWRQLKWKAWMNNKKKVHTCNSVVHFATRIMHIVQFRLPPSCTLCSPLMHSPHSYISFVPHSLCTFHQTAHQTRPSPFVELHPCTLIHLPHLHDWKPPPYPLNLADSPHHTRLSHLMSLLPFNAKIAIPENKGERSMEGLPVYKEDIKKGEKTGKRRKRTKLGRRDPSGLRKKRSKKIP